MRTAYDPNHLIEIPYYRCPACGSEFYGGGPALHDTGCQETGYEPCITVYGPNGSHAAKRRALGLPLDATFDQVRAAERLT